MILSTSNLYRLELPSGREVYFGNPRGEEDIDLDDWVGFLRDFTTEVQVADDASARSQGWGADTGDNNPGARTLEPELLLPFSDPRRRARAGNLLSQVQAELVGGGRGRLSWWDYDDEEKCFEDVYVPSYQTLRSGDGPTKQNTLHLKTGRPLAVSAFVRQVEIDKSRVDAAGGSVSVDIVNTGSAPHPGLFWVWGACDGVTITNELTGETITITRAIADGEFVSVDCWERLATLNALKPIGSACAYTSRRMLWFEPGVNPLTVTPSNPGVNWRFRCDSRSAWL